MKILNYFLRLLFLSPSLLFIYFPSEHNLDYNNYYNDYTYNLFAYDILYEWMSYLVKLITNYSFSEYWLLLMLIQIALIAIIYNRLLLIILAYPVIISLSQFLFGTQIRYSIAALLFIIIQVATKKNPYIFIFMVIPILFHYGMAVPVFLSILSFFIKNDRLMINKKSGLITLIFVALFIHAIILNINDILPHTRFSYYIGSDKYLSSKSISSILFIFSALTVFLYGMAKNHNYRFPLMKFSILLLLFCLATSSIAILSGRVLLVFIIIFPLLIYKLLCISKLTMYTATVLMMYLCMNISFYINNNYYFY